MPGQPNAMKQLLKQAVRGLLKVSAFRFALVFLVVAVVISVMIVMTIDLLWDGRFNAELEFAGIVTPFLDGLFLIVFISAMLNEIREEMRRRKAAEDTVRQLNASLEENVKELSRTNYELQALNTKLAQAQSQLLLSEKMAAVGMLAAGVAHEINNPVGFIKSNMQSLEKYVDDLLRVVSAYEEVEALLPEHRTSFAELHRLQEQIDFEYEKKDILALMSESLQGLERVTNIVQNLKDFSRIESQDKWIVDDIHKEIESTLSIIRYELSSCEVIKEYGVLPPVECLPPQLNQVFMNLLMNAAQAIETKGTITIRTGTGDNTVWIEIADTGNGIAPESLSHIFEPFYTTKPVGKGTGLGLFVSYSIVQKHHGRITVESDVGIGTTFRVWLPVRQPLPGG